MSGENSAAFVNTVVDPESTKPEWWAALTPGKKISTIVSKSQRERGIPGDKSYCANGISYRESYPLLVKPLIPGGPLMYLHAPHPDGRIYSHKCAIDEEAFNTIQLNDGGKINEAGERDFSGVSDNMIVSVTFMDSHPLGTHTSVPHKPRAKPEAVKADIVNSEPNGLKQVVPVPSASVAAQPTKPDPVVSTSTATTKQQPLPTAGIVATGTKPRVKYNGRMDARRWRKG